MKSPTKITVACAVRRLLLSVIGLSLGLAGAFAQSNTTVSTDASASGSTGASVSAGVGTVIGTVTDVGSKLALAGARVSVVGTSLETYTNQAGTYQLADVPAGAVTLEVAYVGYPTKTLSATVTAGQTARFDVAFGEEIVTLGAFNITGDAIGTARAINQERSAPALTNIVASDAIGQLPDKNVAEALERIPGVDLYRDKGEGRFVEILGIDPTWIGVNINGMVMSTTEKGTRETSLDVISSDMISAIEVHKVATPDMDGEGMGGGIDIKTRSGFDQQGAQAMISGGTNWATQEDRHGGYNAAGYFGNTFDDGKLGIFIGVTGEYRPFTVYEATEVDPWQPVLSPTTGQVDQLFGGQDYRHYDVERYRHGIDASLDYKFDPTSSVYFRYTMSYYTEKDNYWATEIPYQSYSSILALNTTSATVALPAKSVLEYNDQVENAKISTSLVGGWNKTFDSFTNDLVTAYTIGKYTRPQVNLFFADTSAATVSYAFSDPWHDSVTQQAGPSITNPANYAFSTKSDFTNTQATDHMKDIKDDLKKDFDIANLPAYVKIGFEYTNTNDYLSAMKDNITAIPFALTSELYPGPDTQYQWGGLSQFRVLQQANASYFSNPAGFPTTVVTSTVVLSSFAAEENVASGYVMGGITLGKLKILVGGRVEDTQFQITGGQEITSPVSYSEVTFYKDYANFLPDVVFTYEFDPRTIGRASWTNTLARPDYGDTLPGRTVDDVNHLVTQGNPEMDALHSMNWDASIEHYYSSLGSVSAALFYKSVSNLPYQATSGIDPSTGYLLTTYYTAPSAWIYGTELDWRQRFGFLPSPLDGLGISANAMFGDSQVSYPSRPGEDLPFVGYSKIVANVALTYDKNGLQMHLAMAHHSPRMEVDSALGANSTQDIYEDAFTEIDFGSSYLFRHHWQVYFNIANLNNAPLREYFGGTTFKRLSDYEVYGPSFESGVKWLF